MGNKKVFSTRVDEDCIKDLKHLAVDTSKSLGVLLEEAIQDLLKKYERKPNKYGAFLWKITKPSLTYTKQTLDYFKYFPICPKPKGENSSLH